MITVVLPTTTQFLLLNPNTKRKRLLIQMRSTIVDANNVGNVKVAYNNQPNTGDANPTTGDMLTQGAYVDKNEVQGTMPPAGKGAIWLFSSVANQSVDYEEVISE